MSLGLRKEDALDTCVWRKDILHSSSSLFFIIISNLTRRTFVTNTFLCNHSARRQRTTQTNNNNIYIVLWSHAPIVTGAEGMTQQPSIGGYVTSKYSSSNCLASNVYDGYKRRACLVAR